MRSLFGRVLAATLAAILVFAAVTAIALISGLNISLSAWTESRDRTLTEGIRDGLEQLYSRKRAATGGEGGTAGEGAATADGQPQLSSLAQEADIAEALGPYLSSGMYALVTDLNYEALFVHRPEPAETEPRGTGRGPGGGVRLLERELNRGLSRLVVDGTTVAYFAAGSEGFAADLANRQLLRTLVIAVVAGALTALLLAVAVVGLLARGLARRARGLADGLAAVRGGDRGVRFTGATVRELASIAESAEALQKEIARQEGLRRQWAQDVAHDLRTPVAALRAQLEAMADGVVEADPPRFARTLDELARLESLVADLRVLTQVESPELELDLQELDLQKLLGELVYRLRPLAEVREVGIALGNPDGGRAPRLRGDPARLERALANVVWNAVVYSPTHSEVRLNLETRAGETRVAVSNPGFIPEDELPRLFDRLYRGEASRTSGGAGLGLTIARAIVVKHGGTIHVANQPGEHEQQPRVVVEIIFTESS